MLTVFKYPIEISDHPVIEMPAGARLLGVQVQHGAPVLYALVDTERPPAQRFLRIAGAGHKLATDSVGEFIGTLVMAGGDLMFHVFAEDANDV